MFKTQRYEAVEIQIPAGTTLTKFNFPDLPNLTGRNGQPVIIDSIVFYSSYTLLSSPISGSNVLDVQDMRKAYLTIYQGDLQVLYNIPLVQLSFVTDPANTLRGGVINQPILKDLINVSWTKSFVSFASAPSSTDVVIVVGVHYTVISDVADLLPTKENKLMNTLKTMGDSILQMQNILLSRFR